MSLRIVLVFYYRPPGGVRFYL